MAIVWSMSSLEWDVLYFFDALANKEAILYVLVQCAIVYIFYEKSGAVLAQKMCLYLTMAIFDK